MQTCELPPHAPAGFRRHEPETTVLYQIVREHVNTFFELADARSGEGRGLPRYVKNAFLHYLECGILAHGFARVRPARRSPRGEVLLRHISPQSTQSAQR